MHVPVAVTKGEKPVVTVLLVNNRETERVLKRFYCVVCGHVAFEYFNDVNILGPGAAPEDLQKAPVVIQCFGTLNAKGKDGLSFTTRCKTRYYVA